MKHILRSLAVVFAVGAMAQAIYAYAHEVKIISLNQEEQILLDLIELRREVDLSGAPYSALNSNLKGDGVEILTEEDFKESFVIHTLRYIQAIDAEDTLRDVLRRPDFQSLYDRVDPAI